MSHGKFSWLIFFNKIFAKITFLLKTVSKKTFVYLLPSDFFWRFFYICRKDEFFYKKMPLFSKNFLTVGEYG